MLKAGTTSIILVSHPFNYLIVNSIPLCSCSLSLARSLSISIYLSCVLYYVSLYILIYLLYFYL